MERQYLNAVLVVKYECWCQLICTLRASCMVNTEASQKSSCQEGLHYVHIVVFVGYHNQVKFCHLWNRCAARVFDILYFSAGAFIRT